MKRVVSLFLVLTMVMSAWPLFAFAEEESEQADIEQISSLTDESIAEEIELEAQEIWQIDDELEASGMCGKTVKWSFNPNGVLNIYGSGPMDDYLIVSDTEKVHSDAPWDDYWDEITEIVIEGDVSSVGKNTFFGGCNVKIISIKTIAVSQIIKIINSLLEEIDYLPNLTEINVDSENSSYSTIDGVLFLKDSYSLCRYPVGKVNKEYVIPNGTKNIGKKAFANAVNLTHVTIPNSVETLREAAFTNCSNLVGVTISNSVTYIPARAFAGCSSLSEIVIPRAVMAIGEDAFKDCGNLDVITYWGTEEQWKQVTIQDGAIPQGTKIAFMAAPIAVTGICGDYVSWALGNDGTLVISGSGAMDDYSNTDETRMSPWENLKTEITVLVIENGVTRIGDAAFGNCTGLRKVYLPESLTEVGESAFENSTPHYFINQTVRQWSGVQIAQNNEWFPHFDFVHFLNADSVITSGKAGHQIYWEYKEDGTAEYFGQGDIYDYWAVSSGIASCDAKLIIIGDGIVKIGCCAFESLSYDPLANSLETVRVGKNVNLIDVGVFRGCKTLKEIYFTSDAPTINNAAFQDVTATCYYPADNLTWTSEVMKDYGGTIVWMPYCHNHYEVIDKAIPPTCTEGGLTEGKHCSICGETLVEQTIVQALGHEFDETWKYDDNAHWNECNNCGEKRNSEAHIYNDNTNQKECSICGFVVQPAQPHQHRLQRVSAKAATCTEPGNKAHYTCDCGKLFDTSLFRREINDPNSVVTAPLGHNWANATCTEAKHCKRCGIVDGEALGHIASDWKHDLVSHWKTCTRNGCGKQLEKADHIDTNKNQRCDICNYSWKNTAVIRSIAIGITNIIRSIFK